MKKYFKHVAALLVVFFGAFMLTSCKYNLYKDWKNAGVTMEKDNCFEAVDVEEVKGMIEDKDSFVLVLATSESSKNVTDIQTLYDQSVYYDYEGKVYLLNVADYTDTISKRTEIKEATGCNTIENVKTGHVVFVIYDKGSIIIDTSASSTSKYEAYISGKDIDVEKISGYIFSDFVTEVK